MKVFVFLCHSYSYKNIIKSFFMVHKSFAFEIIRLAFEGIIINNKYFTILVSRCESSLHQWLLLLMEGCTNIWNHPSHRWSFDLLASNGIFERDIHNMHKLLQHQVCNQISLSWTTLSITRASLYKSQVIWMPLGTTQYTFCLSFPSSILFYFLNGSQNFY